MPRNLKRKAPPAVGGRGPGFFYHQANERALEYAQEALDIARADILELQGKSLATIEQAVDADGEWGKRLITSVDDHARTREFGAILWNDALIGRAVRELVQREIEAREAKRPHRRLAAWIVGLFRRATPAAPEMIYGITREEFAGRVQEIQAGHGIPHADAMARIQEQLAASDAIAVRVHAMATLATAQGDRDGGEQAPDESQADGDKGTTYPPAPGDSNNDAGTRTTDEPREPYTPFTPTPDEPKPENAAA